MKTSIISGVALFSLLIAPLALAQTYYPTSYGCVSVPVGISLGSRGSSVLTLQNFLISRNYPGGGAWMATSYFGAATQAAVRNFQQSQNLFQTGMVDATTASAISRVSCLPLAGQSGSVLGSVYTTPTYPYTYPTPTLTYPQYPTYPNYYGNAPVITSLSQNTGMPGNVVIIYGVGFDTWNNTVNFGGTMLSNISSPNGTSLTFTVPSTYYSYSLAGTAVQLSVSGGRGTSNTLGFTVWGQNNYCGLYGYNNCGCNNYYPYTYGYNSAASCLPANTATPVINYLSPTSGPVGTTVTVYGSGFSTAGNTVHFGTGIITNLNSHDGRSVSFIVPNTLTGFGSQPITFSTYQVSVTNNVGITSGSVPFTVTGLISSGAPVITSVNGPTALSTGSSGLWTVNVNTASNTYLTLSVNWGDQNVYGAASTQQMAYGSVQQTNTLTHTYYQSGTYTIVFTISNSAGQNNSFTTTVVVSGTQGNLALSYLSPQSGRAQTVIAIVGTGFSTSDNIVRFGVGGTQHVSSVGGTTIYFQVPQYVSPCDVLAAGSVCAQYLQQVSPGTYPISVSNTSGQTSGILTFTVVQ